MTKIITTSNGQQYKTRDNWTNASGIAGGVATYYTTKNLLYKTTKPFLNMMTKAAGQADIVMINKGLNEVLKDPKIAEKNLKTIDMSLLPKIDYPFSQENIQRILNHEPLKLCTEDISKYSQEILGQSKEVDLLLKKSLTPTFRILKKFGLPVDEMIRYTLQEGTNAICLPTRNTILVNLKKLGASVFHEIGHTMNPKLNTTAVLTTWTAPLILGTAMLKRKKLEGEECKGKFDKAATFVKNNAGIIGAVTVLPLLGVELLASYKGSKLAKPHVDSATYKLIKKVQNCGAATYLIQLAATGTSIFAASKIKDLLTPPKIIKEQ